MSWTCPKCDRELPRKDYRHYCARVNLDSLFEGRSPELVQAFDKILAEVADWPKVLIGVTPNWIVFTRSAYLSVERAEFQQHSARSIEILKRLKQFIAPTE